ncbi:hypothetical protein Scep_002445 [Stephania cephalantha]|uniref:Uncharacterized protein n=1 Tax=Stephania cephalantha TaxID=152367 RepID=A0AAP0LE36_9MAGN
MALSRQCIANDSRHDNALQMIQLKMFKGRPRWRRDDGERRGGDGGERGWRRGTVKRRWWRRGTVEDGGGGDGGGEGWSRDGGGEDGTARGRWRPERSDQRDCEGSARTVEAGTVETRTVETGTVERGRSR